MNEKKLKFKIIKEESFDNIKREVWYWVRLKDIPMRIKIQQIFTFFLISAEDFFSFELQENVLTCFRKRQEAIDAINNFRKGLYDTIEGEV